MKSRIQEILQREQLSAAQFADKIGVQRSSVSHVLSGRNKPSIDFIQKILQNIDGISADWLLSGRGEFRKKHGPSSSSIETGLLFEEIESAGSPKNLIQETMQYESASSTQTDPLPTTAIPRLLSAPTGQKRLERVLFFYSDNTFTEYRPE